MDVSDAVDRWVANSLAQVSEGRFAQIDLDDLLEDEPAAAAMVGVECLERMLAVLPAGSDLDALLTIPLEPSSGWEQLPPDLDDLLARDWSYGPGRRVPGLYLIHPLLWRVVERVEEYKRPMEGWRISDRVAAYYRTWRDVGESEFERCVYVRSLPA